MIGEMVRVNTWLSQACVKLVVIIKSEVRYLNSESQSYQIFMLQTKVNFVLSVYFGLLYIKNKAQVQKIENKRGSVDPYFLRLPLP